MALLAYYGSSDLLWLYSLQARLVDGTEDSSSEGAAAAVAGRRERRGGSRGGDNQLSDEPRCPISLEVMAIPCYLLLATCYTSYCLLLTITTHYSLLTTEYR